MWNRCICKKGFVLIDQRRCINVEEVLANTKVRLYAPRSMQCVDLLSVICGLYSCNVLYLLETTSSVSESRRGRQSLRQQPLLHPSPQRCAYFTAFL